MTGRVKSHDFVLAEAKALPILDAMVRLDRHHRFIGLVAGEARVGLVAHRLQRLDVVGVAVGREDMADAQALELLDDARSIVRRVDQQRLLAFRIAEHVDVVVVGAHGEARELVHGVSLRSGAT